MNSNELNDKNSLEILVRKLNCFIIFFVDLIILNQYILNLRTDKI